MNEYLKLEMEEGKKTLASVFGVAYSGGKFSQPWEDKPLVLDLNGLAMAPQIPLLLSHENHPDARLGVVQAEVIDNMLLVDGGIDQSTEEGRKIVEMGKQIPWQLSIGARVLARDFVPASEPEVINGKEASDCWVIRKAILREISVVAVGADAETELVVAAAEALNNKVKAEDEDKDKDESDSASINNEDESDSSTISNEEDESDSDAKDIEEEDESDSESVKCVSDDVVCSLNNKGDLAMNEKEVKAIAEAEVQRINDLTACLSDHSDILKTAIEAKWTKSQAESVAAQMAKLAPATPNIHVKSDNMDVKVLQAALDLRAGISADKVSKDERVLEAAEKISRISLREIASECLRLEGKPVKAHFDSEMIRAAFSTTSLPTLLGNTANKKVKQAFALAEPVAPRLCVEADLPDYKVNPRANLNEIGGLKEIQDGQEIPNGALNESTATNQVRSYAEMITIGHKAIVNDDLGEFLRMPTILAQKAALELDKAYFARLLANPTQPDGIALFNGAHGNYASGGTSALSKESLAAAKAMFSKQVNASGDPIAVSPKYLLVPVELEAQALELVKSQFTNGSTTANRFLPTLNIVSEWGLEVIASPYLSNSNYAGNSQTGWYLIADPAQAATMEIGYLRGQREPVVEQADAPFNTYGLQFRVRYDFGVKEQDYRGWVFNAGV